VWFGDLDAGLVGQGEVVLGVLCSDPLLRVERLPCKGVVFAGWFWFRRL